MIMRTKYYRYIATGALLLGPALAFAAPEAAASSAQSGSLNVLLIALVTLIFCLLLIAILLGNVILSLLSAYKDKLRKERSITSSASSVILTVILLLTAGSANAQDAAAVAAAPKIIAGMAAADFYFIVGVIGLELLVITSMLGTVAILVKALRTQPGEIGKTAETKVARTPFWDRFNKAVAIEKETDITLDHDYDGIKELDNDLPPWWKYGFYLTIVVAVIYMYYYHIGGNGPSSLQEYTAEVARGEEQKAAYLAQSANNVDENTVVMLDGPALASGATAYQTACAACHAKDGGGGVGPNLTDNYWLHGGSLQDVFKSIKYGWPDKGMKSWKDDFSPKQIAELSSYVKSLAGTQPAAPKAAQGELYEDVKTNTDSTEVAIDK
jgi:cytochrome c oxidase cbb3-type subunit 3